MPISKPFVSMFYLTYVNFVSGNEGTSRCCFDIGTVNQETSKFNINAARETANPGTSLELWTLVPVTQEQETQTDGPQTETILELENQEQGAKKEQIKYQKTQSPKNDLGSLKEVTEELEQILVILENNSVC